MWPPTSGGLDPADVMKFVGLPQAASFGELVRCTVERSRDFIQPIFFIAPDIGGFIAAPQM
jgi:hypothetical protein